MQRTALLLGGFSVLGVMFFVPGCGGHEHEGCEKPKDLFGTSIQALIDCRSRKDTGYVRGKSFTITVVTVDGKPVERDTANAYYVMQQAAQKAGVAIRIVSGFRTMAEQQYLYNCYLTKRCNNGNLAARPGYSNHQSGHALDLNTSAPGVYSWLSNHGGKYGFKRTVPSEKWHWEWWGGGPGGGPCRDTCTPKCTSKSKFIGKDCKTGDCGVYGAYCTNDKLGLRCYSVFCPALGSKKVCVKEQVGTCKDGKITLSSCPKGKVCATQPQVGCVGANKPKGTLKVACDGISGWAQDPDEPNKALKVQLFFGGPADSKSATRLTVTADKHDAALCKPLGSCKHVFTSGIPWGYLDGKPHQLYGYALDSETGVRHALGGSPKTIQCPYSPPQGVLRHVSNPTVFADWRFSFLWDVLSVRDADLAKLPKASPIPARPVLVKADDGTPEVWLVDGSRRRHITSPVAMSAWRWTSQDVKLWSPNKVYALTKGTSWPDQPMLVKGSGDAVYMLDKPQDDTTPTPEKPSTQEPNASPDASVSTPDGGTIVSDAGWSGPEPSVTNPPTDATGSTVEQGSTAPERPAGQVLVLDSGVVNLQPPDNSGCGCQANQPGQQIPALWWALLLWAGLLWLRRRGKERFTDVTD